MKSLFFLSLFLGLTLLFSGCAPKIVETEPLRPISQNGQAQGNALNYNNQAQGDVPLSNTQASAQAAAAPQEGPVKTLKDFQPITATQSTITTNKGDIVIQLYPDKAPLTVTNFLTLAKSKFYDGIKFHRIIADFMAQVGDPLTKDDSQQAAWGTGGPGYTIQDEFSPDLKFEGEGVVAMANTGAPNTGGSQFFITFGDTTWLNGKHAIFGKVTQGMDVVRSLVIGDQIVSISYK